MEKDFKIKTLDSLEKIPCIKSLIKQTVFNYSEFKNRNLMYKVSLATAEFPFKLMFRLGKFIVISIPDSFETSK
jgi:hypothetical protein